MPVDARVGAQAGWAALPLRARLRVIRAFRRAAAAQALALAATAARPAMSRADILVAEVLPLLAAARFLERRGAHILRDRAPRGRPLWLFGTRLIIRRLPLGVVLVIGPANYPLFLPGAQALQALAAGNAVLLKPAPGTAGSMHALAAMLARAGLPAGVLTVLPEDPAIVREVVAAGVDKVLLTGSSATGRAVAPVLAEAGVPAVMELSGEDPLLVLPGADAALVAAAIAYGGALNGGNTCIAPRRILRVGTSEVPDIDAAVAAANAGAHVLGASVFGPRAAALACARRLRAGCVTVNDLIVPTADPRLPFGGAGASGHGTTRGVEGLLELTRPQAVTVSTRRSARHLRTLPERWAPRVAWVLRRLYG